MNCTGYILTYSWADATSEPVEVQLQPYVHQYIINTDEPVEYTVSVAAATRRGAGPATSHAGDSCCIPACCSMKLDWHMKHVRADVHACVYIPQFLPSPSFLPCFNEDIKSYRIDYVLDTHS